MLPRSSATAISLDFAGDDKKKIAYATFFGSGDFQAPKDFTEKAVKCMRRMNAISVREKEGVDICRRVFGVKADHVLDPVLMADPHVLGDLADNCGLDEKEPYIATYILDPDSRKTGGPPSCFQKLTEAYQHAGWLVHKFPANKKEAEPAHTIENLQVEQWLYYFKNSDFVITDSFHGTCMAILFNKPSSPSEIRREAAPALNPFWALSTSGNRYAGAPPKIS